MNRFKVTFEVETWSSDPTDWILDSVLDNLDPDTDEDIIGLKVERVSADS